MAARGARPKSRPIRRTRHSKDDSDIYAALNDFTDAIEAMPSELVRQFTLLREVDAKYSDLQNKISTEIDTFFQTSKTSTPSQRNIHLLNITRLLTSALGCADEKVSVASSAADISDRHKLRLDTDFARLESGEIAELIRFGPADHPAFVHGSTMGMSRSESRRLAIAQAKKSEEELLEFRKEQIGRRAAVAAAAAAAAAAGGLEEKAARGGAARKKTNALLLAAVAGAPPGAAGVNGVGLGVSGVGGGLGGMGTPPRGATPVGSVSGWEQKKSHHKKKPPRGDNDENTSTATAGQKRKHPNQYSNSSASNRQIMPASANGPGDPDEEELVQNDAVTGDETRYCYCNQVSYGEMVACDRDGCAKEWFHLDCAGLREPPKGEWFCKDCRKIMERESRRGQQAKKARIEGGKGAMR